MEFNSASKAEFEKLASVLSDIASVDYIYRQEVRPRLIFFGDAPDQQGQRFGVVDLTPYFSKGDDGTPGKLRELVLHLLGRREVSLVGSMVQATVQQISVDEHPDDEVPPAECLLITLFSRDCQAVKMAPIKRSEQRASIEDAKLLFANVLIDEEGVRPRPLH